MSLDENIEYLRTLPKNSIVIDGVIDGGVWCREDIGTLIEDNGKDPTPENVERVLAAVPDGLDDFGDRLTQKGWDILHGIYDDAIDAL